MTHALYGLVTLASLCAVWAGGRGVRLVARGIRYADDARAGLWIIRGIRGIVVAFSVVALAGGVVFEQTWLLVFGAVFFAEELYETGVVALVIRAGLTEDRAKP